VTDSPAKRSRAAFAARFPEVMGRVQRGKGAVNTSVVMADGRATDILVDGRSVYGGDAVGFAAGQVEAYMKRPLRFFMNSPTSSGLVSPVCVRLLQGMLKCLDAEGLDGISSQPVDSPSFRLLFGLGLGHHVEELVRRTGARWLIIAEPLLEFFEHSFHVVDWAALLEELDSRDGGIHVVTDIAPTALVSSIVGFMKRHGIPYADGSWVFTHYPLWAFSEARKRLYDAIEFAFVNRGFFEDELVMMTNATANFADRSFWLLEGHPRLQRPEMAVVVGAGASLDESFETIRRIRDRVVIFSGGTSLRPLLRNGIVPDFHCELENVPAVHDVLGEAAKFGDLSQITLLASATVDPRVPPLFREAIFYFRDSVSSTQILGKKYQILPGTAPTCVNLALVSAAYLGFTKFLLFGTDCGIRPGGDHHARDTIYRDVGIYRDKDKDRDINQRYPMEIEGNFGGVARTDWVYDACRVMLAEAIGVYHLDARNCSDGALIPGAVPCVPEAVEVTDPVVDRATLWSTLQRSLQRFQPGEILRELDLDELTRQSRQLFADLDDLLAKAGGGDPDFANVYRAVMDFAKAEDRYGRTDAIISGTLQALPRIAMFFGFRVADPDVRRRFFEVFIKEFRAIAREMGEETEKLLTRLGASDAPLSSPSMACAD
jgi:hypothetical protein